MADQQNNQPNVFERTIDATHDTLDKVSSPSSRSGSVVERIAKSLEQGVHPEVIALQMTLSSANQHSYSVGFVRECQHLYHDSKTRVPLSAAATRDLIKHAKGADSTSMAEEDGRGRI